jgi:light-regulated signal transduction histidine kinase (bacteriophytochrome)
MNARLTDLESCATEPIRVPGAIQPHGRMLVLDAGSGREVAWSLNWRDAAQRQAALAALARRPLEVAEGESPAALGLVEVGGEEMDASAHRLGRHVIVEFEPAAADRGTQAPIYSLARHFLPQLQRARSVDDLLRIGVRELKRLTGFGRCLAYRFDRDGHGEVLAEAMDEGYESYAGHRFPASDIPAQARALYCLNFIRLIPDSDYAPVPLASRDAALAPGAIDLSLAGLRSVSPVHLEYMRNMGTRASMSVSIVVRGQLWGLVSCHDRETRFLSFPTRAACEHLGRLLSGQVEAADERSEVEQRHELRELTLQIIAQRADLDASLLGLVNEPAPMLRLARAAGVAVVLNDVCRSFGDVPPADEILALAEWLRHRGDEVFESDRLPELWPAAAGWGDVGAGVLAIAISQVHRHVILWFRPAVVQTITWAGRPYKEVRAEGRIQPRSSFASWKEELQGRALPWTSAERGAVLELRQSLIGIVLRRAEELNEVAAELGRVNKELEAFSYTVSHDLRAPMRHIAGYVDLVMDVEGAKLGDKSRRYLQHVKDASAYSGRLVDALLDFSRMGRTAIKHGDVDMRALSTEVARELTRFEAGRAIEWDIAPDLPVLWADPVLMQVAMRNLMGNAVKYSRDRAVTRVRVVPARRGGRTGVEVVDNGVGFDMRYVDKLFGVFQRLHQSEQFEGTGIGLASFRRIVERHGGEVWAHGTPGEGARFGFALPDKTEEDN